MAGKNGREVGRVSLRVLPNMDHFRKKVEQQAKGMRPLSVDVEADTNHFEREMQRKTRNRKTTVNVVADTKAFFNHLKKATNKAPSVEVAVKAAPLNFRTPKLPELNMRINESIINKQLDQISANILKHQRKWLANTPSLGVTQSHTQAPTTSPTQLFNKQDFEQPLAIIRQIHKELAKQVRAKMLDDLHKGLDTATTKMGDARKAFRQIYAYKFKPRYVDPFTDPFTKGAANARKSIDNVRQSFRNSVNDMRKELKSGIGRQHVSITSAIQAPKDRKELAARKPDLSGYQQELEALQKVLKARQKQFILENRGKKNQAVGYHRELTEVQKLLEHTKKLRDTDIIGRKAVQDAISNIKKIDKGIVGLNRKLISGETPEVTLKKGRKQDPAGIIDPGQLRAFEKNYTTAFQRVSQKARGELNRIGYTMDNIKGRAQQLQAITSRIGNKAIKPVKDTTTKIKDGTSTQINKIKDVWDSSTAQRYRRAWSAVGKDTGASLKQGMGKGFAYARKESTNLDGSLAKLRKRLDGYRASKNVFGFDQMLKQLGFADKKMNQFGKRTTMGLTRIGWIALAVGSIAAPAIGLIGGALSALPALGAAGLATISLIALGMDGIKEAAQAAAPQFNNLKSSISQIYADGLVSQFEQLGGVIEKTQPAMESVARASMEAGQGFTNAVSSGRGVDLINKTLGNTADMFSKLQPFTQGFTMGLLEMAGAGSETFEGLTEDLNNFGTNFETKMREMSESGALQEAITATFDILGAIGSNLGSILGAGMAELPGMVGPLTNLLDGFGEGLVGIMPILATLTNGVSNLLGTVFSELGSLGQAIAPGFEAGFMGLTDMASGAVEGVSSILQSVAPIFNGLMTGIGPHLTSIGDSLANMGGGFAAAFEPFSGPLGQAVQDIANAIGGPLASGFELLSSLGPVVGEGLGTAFTNAAPGIQSLVEALAPMIEGNFEVISVFITELTSMLPAMGAAVGVVAEAIARVVESPFGQKVMEWVQAIALFLAPVYAAVASILMFWAGIMKVVGVGKLMFTTLTLLRIPLQILFGLMRTNPIGLVITLIALLVGWLINFFRNTEQGRQMWARFTEFLAQAWAVAQALVIAGFQAVQDWWTNLCQTVSDAWTSSMQAVSDFFSSVKEAIVNKFNEIRESWSNTLQGIKDAVSSFDLVASGKALIQGFINGIRSMIGAAKEAASAVVQGVRDFFPFSPAKKGPFSGRGWVLYSGRSIGQAFAQGMLDERSTAASAAQALTKAASDQFKGGIGTAIEEQKRKTIRDEVLKSNADKIARAREQEEEAEKKAAERIAEIRKSNSKQASKDKQIAKVRADLAKKNAERQKELHQDLEAPDYSQINRSFQEYWIGGVNELFKNALMTAVDDFGLVDKTRGAVKQSIAVARREFGNDPIFDQILRNVDSEAFNWAVKNSIEEAGIAEIPVNIVLSNWDQLKSDLGMGDGVLSRGIDAAMQYDPGNTDAKRYKESQEKTEVHYHVADMNEAIRLEKLRERKQMMKIK